MPRTPDELADVVRRAYSRPVDDATAGRHVAAIVEAARRSDHPPVAPRVPARRRRLWRPALVAGAAALALPAGLATAGVSLPPAFTAPYDVVGVELPNQASETARERVRQTPAVTPRPAAPAVPDGGLREGHGADDAARPGERRSEERNKGRRGDEKGRRDEAPRSDRPATPRPGDRGRSESAPNRSTPKPKPPRTTPQPQRPSPPPQQGGGARPVKPATPNGTTNRRTPAIPKTRVPGPPDDTPGKGPKLPH